MTIIGLLFANAFLLIAFVVSTLIQIMSIVFIVIGAIALRKDKEREIEYEKTVSANEQSVKKYKRKIYPRVFLAIGISVQAISLISETISLISEIIGTLLGMFS